ncbi:MAG TPA: hypothetical protein VLI39_06105 [Sedimentisphaerales bacterium]|nr:hypothetical protein [Sedimentisphaerales bacterium]
MWRAATRAGQGHILVCFLAYVLWKTLSQWMQRSGLGDAPRTLLLELAKIKSGDVVLPVRSLSAAPTTAPLDPPVRLIRLRCVTTPDEAQKVLLNRLGVDLPERLRRIAQVIQM